MGAIHFTLYPGTPDEVTITLMQARRLKQLTGQLGESEWHKNDCGCCMTIHPKGQHDRGYVIDEDGGYEWVGPGNPHEEN